MGIECLSFLLDVMWNQKKKHPNFFNPFEKSIAGQLKHWSLFLNWPVNAPLPHLFLLLGSCWFGPALTLSVIASISLPGVLHIARKLRLSTHTLILVWRIEIKIVLFLSFCEPVYYARSHQSVLCSLFLWILSSITIQTFHLAAFSKHT